MLSTQPAGATPSSRHRLPQTNFLHHQAASQPSVTPYSRAPEESPPSHQQQQSSHNRSSSNARRAPFVVPPTMLPLVTELAQEGPMFPWESFRAPVRRRYVSLAGQLAILAALGSLLYGLHVAVLNTSLATINAEFLSCGSDNLILRMRYSSLTEGQCASDPVCRDICGRFEDPDAPDVLTAIRCPGGANDLSCPRVSIQNAWLSSSVLIGALVGSVMTGAMLRLGRRRSFLRALLLMVIGTITSVCAASFAALLWGRLMCGFAVGMLSVVSPAILNETAPAPRRGRLGILHQLLIVLGVLAAVSMGLPLTDPVHQDDFWQPSLFDRLWWRFMIALGLVPAALAAWFTLKHFRFETPLWYVERRRFRDAAVLLQLLNGHSEIMGDLETMAKAVREGQQSCCAGASSCDNNNNSCLRHGKTDALQAFRTPALRRVLVVGLTLAAFQQLGGINAFITSSNTLFERAGLRGDMRTLASVGMAAVNAAFTFPAMWLVERLGRRQLLLAGAIGQLLAVLPAALLFATVDENTALTQFCATAGVLVFVAAFAVGYGPVLWVYLYEIFPTDMRDGAVSLATSVNWAAAIVVVFAAQHLDVSTTYRLFALAQLAACLFIYLVIKETKGLAVGVSPYIDGQQQSPASVLSAELHQPQRQQQQQLAAV